MSKFAVISEDGWDGDTQATYDLSLEEAGRKAESSPDTDFYVVEIKAKVVAELKIDIVTDESKFGT